MARILGPDGQPISTADLREPQTARVAHLHREFASHPARGLTPARLAQILVAAEQGDVIAQYELFEDMEERDAHLHAEMGKRRRAVVGLPWDIVPPSDASAAERDNAKRLREMIESLPDLDEVLFDITDAIGKGFANIEIEWHRVDGRRLPKTLTHRPQTWFRLHRAFRQEIRLRDGSSEGAPLQPLGWITHTHKSKSGYVERSALFRVLVWPYLFKVFSVGDLAEFLEIYGIPLRLGKYPPGSGEPEKATLLRALTSIGHNAAGIIPDGMSIDFEDAATGDPDAYKLMMDWAERSESKAILGATMTSDAQAAGLGSNQANVHNEVRKDIRDADAKQIGQTITRDLVFSIAVLNNMAPAGILRCPRFVFDVSETEDLTTFGNALPRLVGIGMRIPRVWAQTQLGIPEPEGAEDVLVAPALPPAAAALRSRAPHATLAFGARAFVPPDLAEIEALLDQVESTGEQQAQAEQVLAPLIALAESDPESLAERLAELYPELDDAALEDALDRLLFVAQAQGALNARRR